MRNFQLTNLSPAAQAVASAYDDTPEKDTGNHRYLWLAAALRVAADQVVPETNSMFISHAELQQEKTRDQLLAIANELEAQ
jgi:hypothetical protein